MHRKQHGSSAHRFLESLSSGTLTQVMEAHDAISAAIAASKCDAVWASSLTRSLSLGLSDREELGPRGLLQHVHSIVNNAECPTVVDIDTGFGNDAALRLFCTEAINMGIGAICMEDQQYPKSNSILSLNQCQVEPEVFANRINVVRDTCGDRLAVIARIESYICGKDDRDAQRRAKTYAAAGADALVVHSKAEDSSQIRSFMAEAADSLPPIVVIPTTYPSASAQELHDLGVSGVIWANHLMRAAMQAMEETVNRIAESGGQSSAVLHIAGLDEVKRHLSRT